jgi:alpha-tubulin suppressor-like RCC1 family protein
VLGRGRVPGERRSLWRRLALVVVLVLAGLAAAAAPGAGDSSEGGIAATRDSQRLISLGAQHSCAITDEGAIECWGDNSHGQLGTGDRTTSTKPRLVAGITGALEVGAGTAHTCALVHGGIVKCWGINGSGQVGAGVDDDQLTPFAVPLAGVRHIAVGSVHSCALMGDGSVRCWGQNGMGQLGDGAPGGTTKTPVAVLGIDIDDPAADLTAGENHTCARMVDQGRLQCWGHNGFGQLGDGSEVQRPTPVSVAKPGDPAAAMTGVLAMSAGGAHTCALLGGDAWPDNPVYCWGQNAYGQLGHSTPVDPADNLMSDSLVPLRVQIDTAPDNPLVDTDAPMVEARSVSAGQLHNCAVMDTGAVRCWGQNGHGQLGRDRNPLTPKVWEDSRWANPVPALTASAAVAGGFHSCVVTGNDVHCWGYDFYGQLGGHVSPVGTPTTVTGIRGAMKVATANNAACALVTDNVDPSIRPACWGSNADGRLGVDDAAPTSTEVAVPIDLDSGNAGREAATSLYAGNGSFCATPVGVPGERCWGLNGHREIVDSGAAAVLVPSASTHLAGVTSYDLGGTFAGGVERGTTCKVVSGNARCWGYNGQGQVGDATTTDRTAPVDVLYDPDPDNPGPLVPLPGVTDVAVGGDHACAVVGGGQVRCWGANGVGQLGTNNTDAQTGAVLVQKDTDEDANDPLTGATSLVAGDSHTCALLSSGKVRCWGLNSRGQLGTSGGSRDEADQDVRAVGAHELQPEADLADASRLVSGDDHTCALRTSDSVTCWGENADGQLGSGAGGFHSVGQRTLAAPDVSLPEPFIKDVAASRRNSCAVLLDRTVQCWGDNTFGQVGDGIGTHSLTPVEVGGGASVGGNHIPEPQDLTAETEPGVAVAIPVPLTGIDDDLEAVTLVSVSDPQDGTSAITGPAEITYTPDAGCHDDTFTYVVTDGTAQVAAQVRVLMNCAPVAAADTATTPEDQQIDIDVLANDVDEDGDTLTVSDVIVAPAHGTAVVVGGKVRYTPAADYCSPPADTFTYQISDGHSHQATAAVTVTVTCGADGPAVADDAVDVPEDTATVIDVLANDGDPDGDPLTITSVGAAAHGTTSTNGATVRYVPAADYCGPDSFTYTSSDGSLSASGTVAVSVLCNGDSPRPTPDTASTPEDTAVDIDVLANDNDPDGDSLSLTGTLGQPAHGSVAVEGGQVRYVPDPDYCGADTFSYVVSDGTLTATGSVEIDVTCVNDPPVAAPDAASTNEDVTVHVHVLTNDTDPDGQPLTVANVSDPAHGTAVGAIDDAVAYTPDPDFFGTDSFTYDAVDPTGASSTATVTVTVLPVDDPVQLAAVPDQTLAWGDPFTVLFAGTDIDGDPISYSVSPLAPGMDVTGAAFTWTPTADQVGTRELTVTATAGGATATASFRVTVEKRATVLTYDGPTSGQLSDPTPVRAVLLDAATLAPVAGEPVTFTLGVATGTAPTSPSGVATTTLPISGVVGVRSLGAAYSGDAAYTGSSDAEVFVVARETLSVRMGGNPHVVVSGASSSVTYVADLAEEADGTYAGALSGVAVTFKRLDGTTICTGGVSSTGPGTARATCTATQPVGALGVLVSAASASYTPRWDVGVVTVANPGTGFASGAGRVAGDAFGFQVRPQKKGPPLGNLVHVVGSSGVVTVAESSAVSSLSTTCTGGGSDKVCTVTIDAPSATARTVDLATGVVTAAGAASMTVTASGTDRYGVVLAGVAPRSLPLTVLDAGAVKIG